METDLLRDLAGPNQATRDAAKIAASRLTNAEFVALCNGSTNVPSAKSPKDFAVGVALAIAIGCGVDWVGNELIPTGDVRVPLASVGIAVLIVGVNAARMMVQSSADASSRVSAALCDVIDSLATADRLTAVIRPVYDVKGYAQVETDDITRCRMRALARILPLLTHYQLSTLNRAQRTAITQPLYIPYECVAATLAVIESIGELGDKHLLPQVEVLARTPGATPQMVAVRDAAQACLDRVNHVQETGKDDTVLLQRADSPAGTHDDSTKSTDDQDKTDPPTQALSPNTAP